MIIVWKLTSNGADAEKRVANVMMTSCARFPYRTETSCCHMHRIVTEMSPAAERAARKVTEYGSAFEH